MGVGKVVDGKVVGFYWVLEGILENVWGKGVEIWVILGWKGGKFDLGG